MGNRPTRSGSGDYRVAVMLSLLGSTELRSGGGEGTPVDLGSRKPRSVLAALALRLGSEMSADCLVELVWGGAAPGGAHGTLHAYISGLRRALEPDLQPRQPPSLLVTGDHGYRLDLPRTAVDTHAFADGVRAAHRRLSPLAGQLTGGWEHSWPGWDAVSEEVDRLEQLLGWWRGTPLSRHRSRTKSSTRSRMPSWTTLRSRSAGRRPSSRAGAST